jgi:hypothetical protein
VIEMNTGREIDGATGVLFNECVPGVDDAKLNDDPNAYGEDKAGLSSTSICKDALDITVKAKGRSKRTENQTQLNSGDTSKSIPVKSPPKIKYGQPDPSVAHIIDFTSDEYVPGCKEKMETCEVSQIVKKRRQYVTPPDPRPLLGCTWCGPTIKDHNVDFIQIKGDVCPACKHFLDQGWDRVYLKRCHKITFTRPDGLGMSSVKEFLEVSSKILRSKLGGLPETAPKERGAKIAESTQITKRSRLVETAPKERGEKIAESAQITKRSLRVKDQSKALDVSEIKEAKKPIQNPKMKMTSSKKRKSDDISPVESMKNRKVILSAQDPRPVAGCTWCGPPSSDQNIICVTCQIFVNEGMTRVKDKTAKRCFFYDGNGNKLYESKLQYLKGTTQRLLEQQTDGSDTSGMSAKEITIPESSIKTMQIRKNFVSAPDMRPVFGCSW